MEGARGVGVKIQEPAVRFEQVTVALGEVLILEAVNALVPRGSSTAVIGPNGAGKTTLLLALLGQQPFTGEIQLACAETGGPQRVGYVPQRLDFDRGLPLTVVEFMVLGFQRAPLWLGVGRRHRERARAMLAKVQADHLADRRIGALSGGELQRVLLALALQQTPQLLVLDEPAAGMDILGGHLLCELLETLRGEQGFTQIMVSHDLSVVTAHATHVICLNRTVLGEGPPAQILRPEVLEATFGLHRGLPDWHGLPQASGGHGPECDCREHEDV